MGGSHCRCCCCCKREDVPLNTPPTCTELNAFENHALDTKDDESNTPARTKKPRAANRDSSGSNVRYHEDPNGSKMRARGANDEGKGAATSSIAVEDEQMSLEDINVEFNIKMTVRAVHDYSDEEDHTLSFRVGDIMEVTKGADGDWWLARKLDSSGEEGYIPSNFVQLQKSLLSYDWFYGKPPRGIAEVRLLDSDNPPGTFLVRESDRSPGSYALSLLVDTPKREVKHYLIHHDNDSLGFFISRDRCFETLELLVEGYIAEHRGLCRRLGSPCAKQRPQIYDLSKSTRDNWEISKDELEFIVRIGQGNFGEVWKGRWKKQKDVAIKKLKQGSMEPDKFLLEAAVMKTLRHERLVSLLAVCTKELYIVTELLQGSLLDRLRNEATLNITDIVEIARQIAEGMYYIEKQGYIHRDLAARNILLVDNHTVKIGDFGLSRAIMEENFYRSEPGGKLPVKWMAPESINMNLFTIKSDVWSYGILLVELTTKGVVPYPGFKHADLLPKLQTGYRHPKPTSCPNQLYEIMTKCWKLDTSLRPSFSELTSDMERLLNSLPDELHC